MIARIVSACVTTGKMDETREFYVRYFVAEIVFDCGWYLDLQFGNKTSRLAFMSPRNERQTVCNPDGLVLDFAVEDVDAEYRRLTGLGLTVPAPPEDHPWGDRSFSVQDPNGILLLIYSETEPDREYKKYYRQ
jgi:uncharacterized glyoxalase superfamily protein PhnB